MNFSKDVYEFNQKMRYHLMSTAELRAVARRDGIKDHDTLCKADLLNRLYDLDAYSGEYSTMTELRDDARGRGLSGYSEMCKAELIELLRNDDYNIDIYNRESWSGLEYDVIISGNNRSSFWRIDDDDSCFEVWETKVDDDSDEDNDSIGSLFPSDDDE